MMNYKEFVRDRYNRGERVPAWKGFFSYDYKRNQTIVAPILFNILFHWLLAVYYFISAYPVPFERFRNEQKSLRKEDK